MDEGNAENHTCASSAMVIKESRSRLVLRKTLGKDFGRLGAGWRAKGALNGETKRTLRVWILNFGQEGLWDARGAAPV